MTITDYILDTEQQNQKGFLRVQTFLGEMVAPVADVKIDVSQIVDGKQILITSVITNSNGNTEVIELSAPNKELSQQPSIIKPYSNYNIKVSKDGFYTKEFIDIPVFPDSTAIQSVQMVPLLPEDNNKKTEYYLEAEPQNL